MNTPPPVIVNHQVRMQMFQLGLQKLLAETGMVGVICFIKLPNENLSLMTHQITSADLAIASIMLHNQCLASMKGVSAK